MISSPASGHDENTGIVFHYQNDLPADVPKGDSVTRHTATGAGNKTLFPFPVFPVTVREIFSLIAILIPGSPVVLSGEFVMRAPPRKLLWIAIALMIVLCGVSLTAASTVNNEYPCPYDNLKRAMGVCEKACLMPDGPMDIYCYEYCIDELPPLTPALPTIGNANSAGAGGGRPPCTLRL